MNQPVRTLYGRDALDPARLIALAGELDVAGEGLTILAQRAPSRRGAMPYLIRASACHGAAHLLRRIAE